MGQWPRDLTPKVASWSQIIYLLIKNRAQVALEMAFMQETHRSDRMTNELWDLHVSVALLKNHYGWMGFKAVLFAGLKGLGIVLLR